MFGGLWDTATSFVEGVAGGDFGLGSNAESVKDLAPGGFFDLAENAGDMIAYIQDPPWDSLPVLGAIPDSWTDALPGLGGLSEVGSILGGALGDLGDGELPSLDDVVNLVTDTAQDTVLDGLGIPAIDDVIDTVQTFAEDFSPDRLMDLGRDLLGDAVDLPDSIDGLVSQLASGDTGGLLDNLLGEGSPLGGLGEFVDGLGIGGAGEFIGKVVGDGQIGRLLEDIGGGDVADLLGKVAGAGADGLRGLVDTLDPDQTTQLLEKLVGAAGGAAQAAGSTAIDVAEDAVAFAGSTAGVAMHAGADLAASDAAAAADQLDDLGTMTAQVGQAVGDDVQELAQMADDGLGDDVLGVDAAASSVSALDEVDDTQPPPVEIEAPDEIAVDALAAAPAPVAPEPVLVEEPPVVEAPESELTTAVEAADQVEESLDDMFNDLQ
jgi:hypothetical protein